MTFNIKDKRFRENLIQTAFVAAIILTVVMLALTAQSNLKAQGMTSGFDFLERSTGWRISFSLIDYRTSSPYWKAILVGALNSLFLGAIALPLATIIGFAVGTMRTSGNGVVEFMGTSFVELFRNIPLILQLLFWYALLLALPSPRTAELSLGGFAFTGRGIYTPGLNVTALSVLISAFVVCLIVALALWLGSKRWLRMPSKAVRKERRLLWLVMLVAVFSCLLLGRIPDTSLMNFPIQKGLNFKQGIRISPELMACVIAISVYGAAYIAEIIRAGFNAVPRGQAEAGRALGLTGWQIFSRVRLPLAIRIVMPTLINQYVWLFKATTIGIAISFTDFFMVISTAINQSGQTLELIAILMGGFLIINYAIAWVLNRVNDAIKLKGTQLRI